MTIRILATIFLAGMAFEILSQEDIVKVGGWTRFWNAVVLGVVLWAIWS